MKPTRKISRRSFIGRVAGGALVGGAALTAIATRAQAQVTDSDTGPLPIRPDAAAPYCVTERPQRSVRAGRAAAPALTKRPQRRPGKGRGSSRTGITDGDAGRTADPGGNGRGRPNRRCTGVTDGDSGRYVDRGGCGRGRPRR